MDRITIKPIEALRDRMAGMLGAPAEAWSKNPDGAGYTANVGALVIRQGSKTYGNAWTISRLVNTGGGESVIVRGSTAAELYAAAHAWCEGFFEGQRIAQTGIAK